MKGLIMSEIRYYAGYAVGIVAGFCIGVVKGIIAVTYK